MDDKTLIKEFQSLRDYLEEKEKSIEERWRIINQFNLINPDGSINEEEYLRIFNLEHNDITIRKYITTEAFLNDIHMMIQAHKDRNKRKGEPFQFYTELDLTAANPLRTNTAPGIRLINLKYHETLPVIATEEVPETGFRVAKLIEELIHRQYPQYIDILNRYVRPLGTTDATFADFNKPQFPSSPPSDELKEKTLRIVKHFLNVKPYRPIHYTGTAFARLPLSTGTGYYDRNSYKTTALAKMTRSNVYKERVTSKGYYFNATYTDLRSVIHNFKHYRLPHHLPPTRTESPELLLARYYAQHPTMVFTRAHISEKPKLKQRPVYNVDPCFLKIETMLTFPAMVQARTEDSCLMYSFETIRGGSHYMDNVAKRYSSYFTIDWSSYDQTLPREIYNIYYTDFLESLIVINKGYQPSVECQDFEGDPALLFGKMDNLLSSLHQWYLSMVFITADGYAYQRTSAGVPSGLLNTQYLDSFGNLYVIIDGLLNYGFTEEDIYEMRFFIMGDDNSGFTKLPLLELEKFITWFSSYASARWHMTLSTTKSVITNLRHRIEMLSYTCNFGMPIRPVEKLVAQLCLPERQMKPKYMSYRAIGMAYAAAGSDPVFHQFCRDIYMLYFHEMEILNFEQTQRLWKHLPGIFRGIDNITNLVDFDRFPDIYQVREVYSTWHGTLRYHPKWDYSYFVTDPVKDDEDIITLADYRKLHNIPRHDIKEININDYL